MENDKKIELENGTVINQNMEMVLRVLEANDMLLGKVLIRNVRNKTILVIADKELKHSPTLFKVKGNKVYVNASPYAKVKKGVSHDEYNFDIAELYSLLLEGYASLHAKEILYSRDCINDIAQVYAELVRKALLRNGHLDSVKGKSKLDFMNLFYVLSNTPDKIVTNVQGYSRKKAEIDDETLALLITKYPEYNQEKPLNYSKSISNLIAEFPNILKEMDENSFKYNLAYCYGATNDNIYSDLVVVIRIILDYTARNKATLYVLKNNFIKDAIKPTMYNNIINRLIEKASN